MNNLLADAAVSLLRREAATIVAATGLVFAELGEGGPVATLEEVLSSYRTGTWGKEALPGSGYPTLRSTNMRQSRVDVLDAAYREVPEAVASACSLQTGDILVTKSSGSSDLVGKATLFVHPGDSETYLFSNFVLRLRPDSETVMPAYLAWFLRSPQALMWRFNNQHNAVGLRNLQTRGFLAQEIPVPDVSVQQAVVSYLNTLDEGEGDAWAVRLPGSLHKQRRLVARTEELAAKIEEARRLRQEAIAEAQTLSNAFLSTLIETAGDAWERTAVADVVISMDAGWSPQCKDYPARDGDWGVLKTTAVQWRRFVSGQNKALPSSLLPRPDLQVRQGDVLVTRAGPRKRVGVIAMVHENHPNLMISDKLIRLRPDPTRIESRFLELSLSSALAQDFLVQRKTGLADAQVNISQRILRATPVAAPTLAEQRAIIDSVDRFEQHVWEIAPYQQSAATELDALLPSILNAAFNGEL